MKNNRKILIFAFAVLFAGCGFLKKEAAPPTRINSTNSVKAPENKPINPATPTETMKEFSEAIRRQDYEAVKKLFSKATIVELEKTSSVKAFVDNAREFNRDVPETKNEKINGNTATIGVKDPGYDREEKWTEIKFIKEDGIWKITRSGR